MPTLATFRFGAGEAGNQTVISQRGVALDQYGQALSVVLPQLQSRLQYGADMGANSQLVERVKIVMVIDEG
jgi:hypothetical protein